MNTLMKWPTLPTFDNRIDRFFDGFFEEAKIDADASVKDGILTISLELPGFESKDVDISIDGRKLKIAAKNETRQVARSYVLTTDVDAAATTAELKLGILTIKCPQKSKDGGIHIEVK